MYTIFCIVIPPTWKVVEGVYRIGDVGLYIFPSIFYTLGYSSLIHNFSYTSE